MFYCWYVYFLFFLFLLREISVNSSLRNFATWSEVNSVLESVSPILGLPPKNGGQNHAKFGAILDNFRLRTRISETDRDIRNRKDNVIDNYSSRGGEKSPVNFGPLTTSFYRWTLTHPNPFFGKTTFRPLRGAAISNFCVLEHDEGLLTSTPRGRGSPNNF